MSIFNPLSLCKASETLSGVLSQTRMHGRIKNMSEKALLVKGTFFIYLDWKIGLYQKQPSTYCFTQGRSDKFILKSLCYFVTIRILKCKIIFFNEANRYFLNLGMQLFLFIALFLLIHLLHF